MKVLRGAAVVVILLLVLTCSPGQAASLGYVPMDDRPVNLEYVLNSVRAAGTEIVAPPAALIAGRDRFGNVQALWQWVFDQAAVSDALVLSSDSLIYGGLVPSRTHMLDQAALEERLRRFQELRTRFPALPIYVFGTVMRTPKMSAGATEPPYYEKYGSLIFRITALEDKNEIIGLSEIEQVELKQQLARVPEKYMLDWRTRRAKNLQVNLHLQSSARAGGIDYLLLGRDDSSPLSASHQEGRQLESAGRDLAPHQFLTIPGADNLGMSMVVRAINNLVFRLPFVRVFYAPGAGGATIASYEDRPLGETIPQHIVVSGGLQLDWTRNPDLVLAVNTPESGHTPEANGPKNSDQASLATKQFASQVMDELNAGQRVAVGDVAFGNGADNALLPELGRKRALDRLAAYSGWNTAGNTLGYALGQGMLAMSTPDEPRKKLLAVRYLDDWAYQANIRSELVHEIVYPRGNDGQWLNQLKPMLTTEAQKRIRRFASRHLPFIPTESIDVEFPWNRMFELGVTIR